MLMFIISFLHSQAPRSSSRLRFFPNALRHIGFISQIFIYSFINCSLSAIVSGTSMTSAIQFFHVEYSHMLCNLIVDSMCSQIVICFLFCHIMPPHRVLPEAFSGSFAVFIAFVCCTLEGFVLFSPIDNAFLM